MCLRQDLLSRVVQGTPCEYRPFDLRDGYRYSLRRSV